MKAASCFADTPSTGQSPITRDVQIINAALVSASLEVVRVMLDGAISWRSGLWQDSYLPTIHAQGVTLDT